MPAKVVAVVSIEEQTSVDFDFRVEPMFLHRTRAGQAFGIDEATDLGAFAVGVIEAISNRGVIDLRVAALTSELSSLCCQVVRLRSGMYFRYEPSDWGERCTFHYRVLVDDGVKLAVQGVFDPGRFEATSPREHLSGHRNVYVVGIVDEVEEAIPSVTIHPILIGRPYFVPVAKEAEALATSIRPEVYPSNVDEFRLSTVNPELPASREELSTLFGMSEQQVKQAFASILGVSTAVVNDVNYLPKDWGGETSDLVANITIKGVTLRAAFAFKGPGGKPNPWRLYPRGMGKNGDQAQRLFSEVADIMVVQHCWDISQPVRHLMEALCVMHNKRYMIVDGNDTVQILRRADLLG